MEYDELPNIVLTTLTSTWLYKLSNQAKYLLLETLQFSELPSHRINHLPSLEINLQRLRAT